MVYFIRRNMHVFGIPVLLSIVTDLLINQFGEENLI